MFRNMEQAPVIRSALPRKSLSAVHLRQSRPDSQPRRTQTRPDEIRRYFAAAPSPDNALRRGESFYEAFRELGDLARRQWPVLVERLG